MKKILLALSAVMLGLTASAQIITAKWELSDKDNLGAYTLSGDDAYTSVITTQQTLGSNIGTTAQMTGTNADTGYEAVAYDPYFTTFTPKTKVTGKSDGHFVCFAVTPQSGHTFKPTSISFDAAKVGTDGGNVDAYYRVGTTAEVALATGLSPLRNKIGANNSTGFSHFEYSMGNVVADGKAFYIYLYIYNLNGTDTETPKAIGFRNVQIKGIVDEPIYNVSNYVSSFTCTAVESYGGGKTTLDLLSLSKNLTNGGLAAYPNKLYGDPTDFKITLKEGYTQQTSYSGNVATVKIYKDGEQVFYFEVRFKVTYREPKPAATPLKRGLMSVSLNGAGMGTGNLVSWRHREADGTGVKYKLYRGNNATTQSSVLNSGKYIINRTNFNDTSGSASSYYKLEVYDEYGHLLETEVSGKTWANQTLTIKTSTPIDTRNGATYTPNDASYCDMDGDGEYEIILKWSPSNEKDAASSGTTSNVFFDCYKLDGTQLWRIDMGPNFFASAHTIQFIAWDLDGDGYGEFMVKTAPGTVDGEGNYVLLGNDDPHANLLSSRGKQDHGSEYITVFDGTTGAELATIPYHTKYTDTTTSIWGDSNQNRSERYLAAIAWLDGPEGNPSPIFARGYYSGAFVGAYDWDGDNLTERWVSRNTTKGQGLWGEGAHWVSVGDCDGDGKQEIVYGSAAIDHDGSLLYRTGLGHGDALHLGDFLPEREGLEVFMVHEEKPYGYDLRDAKTGQFILRKTESGDTGRGLAAHFDSSSPHSQFIYSASSAMFDCETGKEIASSWTIGQSGAGINNRIYWDGDLYDEFFDKSIIAHWNSANKWFDRYKFNNGNYVWGKLNNGSKNNPCVLGDLLGDWREEIVTWNEADNSLYICATSFSSNFRIPHLMDDLNYRAQVINQNCCYNQPPHLSYDPAVKYKGNPNVAEQEDKIDPNDDTRKSFSITIVETVNGTVTANIAEAKAGNKVTLTVTASEGYELSELSVTYGENNTPVEVTDDYTFIMPEGDVKVSATFTLKEVKVFSIEIAECENGTVKADVAEANAGDKVTLTVTASEGYELSELSVVSGEKNTPVEVSDDYTFIMPEADVKVGATFTLIIVDGISGVSERTKPDGKYLEDGKVVLYINGVKYGVSGTTIK